MAKPLDKLLNQAIELHSAGRLDEADQAYAKALKIAPSNHAALLWSGVLANQQDRFGDALKRLTAAQRIVKDNATCHLHLGVALNALGRADEAITAYRRAIDLDPANPDAFNNLGVALEAVGRPIEAAEAYQRAINLNPASATQYANLGNALRDAGRTEEALAAYRSAVALDPRDVWAFNNMGTAQLYLGDLPAAVASYRQALALAPDFLPPRANLCKALFDLRLLVEAIQEYRAAIALHPQEKTLLLAFAQLLYETNSFLEAGQFAERALAVDPDYPEAHMLYASCLDALGETDAARRRHEQALRLKNLYVEPFVGVRKRADLLLLACAGDGNLPTNFLLHPREYGKITLHPQYPLAPGETLPPHDLVFNIIGDPDVAEAALTHALAFAETCGKPVLNHPAKVMRTKRHLIAERLSEIPGVVIPRTVEIEREAILSAAPEALLAEMGGFPFLIRRSGSHGGEDLEKVDRVEDLADYLEKVTTPRYYLTRFVDFSDSAGLFRKYRVIFVDGRIYPLHLCIDRKWKVHYYTSLMPEFAWMREEEARFLADIRNAFPPKVYAAAEAVAKALDLDYAGMDCSITREGELLVFEANANMLVHLNDPKEVFPYKHEFVPRVFEAMHDMIDRRLDRRANRPGGTP